MSKFLRSKIEPPPVPESEIEPSPVPEFETTGLAGGWKVKSSGPRSLHYNRGLDKVVILLIPAAFFVYASTRTVLRLRAVMPTQFVEAPATATPRQRAAEERIALAYWNCALTFIQWKHTYGSVLPEEPPADFRIDDKAIGPPGAGAASRLRYWRRLRQLWFLPDAWASSPEWSTQWLTGPVIKVVDAVESFVNGLWRSG